MFCGTVVFVAHCKLLTPGNAGDAQWHAAPLWEKEIFHPTLCMPLVLYARLKSVALTCQDGVE